MRIARLLAAACIALAAPWAAAQDFPSRPLRLVVPFPAGGATDVIARVAAERAARRLGQPMVVENRPGAGGTIGADSVAKAAPDGYTLLLTTPGVVAINPHLYAKMPYDAQKDLVPVALLVRVPNLLVVHPAVPAKDVRELIALLRANPGRHTFGSAGNGTTIHLAGELFKSMTNTFVVHIPYRGSAPAVTDLIAGSLTMMFDGLPSVLPHVRAGRLRALAVTSRERSAALPEVPSLHEAGLPGYEAASWGAVFAPAGVAPATVTRLARAFDEGMRDAEARERVAAQGFDAASMAPEAIAAMVRAEYAKWGAVVRRSGARLD
ncbi:MAG: tripartite tricarboxylate transporter substrate binding protein [Burkholderiales bacterium]|nr:tripartite tricarboxylate transporter substrate binding protein [Burkholderiales bacterium]